MRRRQERVNRGRNGELGEVADQLPAAVERGEDPGVDQHGEELLHEEGVPLCRGDDLGLNARIEPCFPEQVLDDLPRVSIR